MLFKNRNQTVTGPDLNSSPTQEPSRFVINFWDWPKERAQNFVTPFEIIQNQVKPHRDKVSASKKRVRDHWWNYEALAKDLYHALGRGDCFENRPKKWVFPVTRPEKVLALSRVSKTLAFSFVNSGCIFSEQVVVFIFKNRSDFSVLQSNLHAVFAWQHSSKMKNDLRYGPTDAFEPFAFPDVKGSEEEHLTELGESYHESRRNWMLAEDQGLTKLYRHYHDSYDTDPRIANLRDLHLEIDLARAYGWDDLDLGHGFHEVPYLPENDRMRFTISEPARIEVLRRLAELNRQRYEEEVAQGLHGKKKPATKRGPRKSAPKQNTLNLGDLLNFDPEP